MKTLLVATRNSDKLREIRAALASLQVDLISGSEIENLPEIVEDAGTLEGNAAKKAMTLFELTGIPTIADDTGLEVAALAGAPGVYSSRYSGADATYADNVRKLLHEMRDVPPGQRQARFRTVIAFASDAGLQTVEGICEGEITTEPRGDGKFGYDPVFFVPEAGKNMAEMSLDEKNRLSHRGLGLKKMAKILQDSLK